MSRSKDAIFLTPCKTKWDVNIPNSKEHIMLYIVMWLLCSVVKMLTVTSSLAVMSWTPLIRLMWTLSQVTVPCPVRDRSTVATGRSLPVINYNQKTVSNETHNPLHRRTSLKSISFVGFFTTLYIMFCLGLYLLCRAPQVCAGLLDFQPCPLFPHYSLDWNHSQSLPGHLVWPSGSGVDLVQVGQYQYHGRH